MCKLCTFSNHCFKNSVTPIRLVLVLVLVLNPLRGGEFLNDIHVCTFLNNDKNSGIGKVHDVGTLGGGGDGRVQRSVP